MGTAKTRAERSVPPMRIIVVVVVVVVVVVFVTVVNYGNFGF